jgi:uncharacterized membrane protein YkoI
MAQRFAFAVAAGLTAFVVMVLVALVTYVVIQGPSRTTAAISSNGVAAAQQAPAPSRDETEHEGSDTSDDESTSYAVSAERATGIALSVAPGASLLQQPRLVNMNGVVAYEVPLDKGNVYVDANSGQVLYGTVNGQPRRRPRR